MEWGKLVQNLWGSSFRKTTSRLHFDRFSFFPHFFLGGGFQIFFDFHPLLLGKMNPFLTSFFFKGVIQPPTMFFVFGSKFCHPKIRGFFCLYPGSAMMFVTTGRCRYVARCVEQVHERLGVFFSLWFPSDGFFGDMKVLCKRGNLTNWRHLGGFCYSFFKTLYVFFLLNSNTVTLTAWFTCSWKW